MELSWSLSNGSKLTALGTSETHGVGDFPQTVLAKTEWRLIEGRLRRGPGRGAFACQQQYSSAGLQRRLVFSRCGMLYLHVAQPC